MNAIARAIRKSTGLTLREFCETQLNSKWVTFSVRLRKNRLYPNEYVYICLVTGQKFSELFADTFNNKILLKGDESVTEKINALIKADGWNKLNDLIQSPIDLDNQQTLNEETAEAINQIKSIGVTEHSAEVLLQSSMEKINSEAAKKEPKKNKRSQVPPEQPKAMDFAYEETY